MQNVGTPRFYVDILQWLKAQGGLSLSGAEFEGDNLLDLIGINPTQSKTLIPEADNTNVGGNDVITFKATSPFNLLMPNDKNFFMVLGHNLSTAGASIYVQEGEGTGGTWTSAAASGLVNYTYGGINSTISQDGFSISIGNDAHDIQTNLLRFRLDATSTDYNTDIKIGSLLYGTYYDMPHSPDLNLKLFYEYDGVQTIQTKGGATISNATYTKPADWGDGGAWQLGSDESGNPISNLRSGRRVWDLSFSYLSDTDLMPVVAATTNLGAGDIENIDSPNENTLLDGTDFFSQVINKTMGGHLPFIFQADGSATNPKPDQFAIARFDMNSFSYDQVANNVYNVKIKVREVW